LWCTHGAGTRSTNYELSLYSYEVDEHTGEVLPKLADKKNHTIDALRYAVESHRRSNVPFVVPYSVSVPRNIPGQ
jgi:phage terminase large subunit